MTMPNPDALTGGRWVTRPGGLRIWQPDQPYTDRTQAADATRIVLDILTAIAAGPTTCDCGCLLINRHERCPACLVARQQEQDVA